MDDSLKLLIGEYYVDEVKKLGDSISVQQTKIEKLRAICTGLSSVSNGDKITSTTNVHKLEDSSNELIEAINEYTTKLNEYISRHREASQYFSKLQSVQCNALTAHYLNGMTWEETCVVLNYSYPRIMQIRKESLISLCDIFPFSLQEEIRIKVIPKAI